MNIDQQFPSKWLNATDLQDSQTGRYKETTQTILETVIEKVGRDNAPVVYFEGKRKGLVLNGQRAGQIKTALGTAETDEWVGHRITLYVAASASNGKDYINVKESRNGAARHTTAAASAPEPAPPPRQPERTDGRGVRSQAEVDGDDVPF